MYQGLTREGLYDRHPEFGVHSLRARPEGGESFLDLRERVLSAFERLQADAAGETVLVVTHRCRIGYTNSPAGPDSRHPLRSDGER